MNLSKTKQDRNFGSLDPLVKANQNDLSEEALFLMREFPSVINKELATEVIRAR